MTCWRSDMASRSRWPTTRAPRRWPSISSRGASPRPANLIAITVGLGIGAGLVLGGELFHGDGFGAGEIGHTTVEEDGDECRCGRFGCLETVASSRAILRRATDAARENPASSLGVRLREAGELHLEDVAAANASGDESARRIVLRGRQLSRPGRRRADRRARHRAGGAARQRRRPRRAVARGGPERGPAKGAAADECGVDRAGGAHRRSGGDGCVGAPPDRRARARGGLADVAGAPRRRRHRRHEDRDPRVRPEGRRGRWAVRARAVAPTAVGASERAADSIASLVAAALAQASATPDDVAALGVGVPGRVDRETGHVTLAVNLDWHDLPLARRLEARLGIPTTVENDVRAAALGLHQRRLFGSASRSPSSRSAPASPQASSSMAAPSGRAGPRG